MNRMYSQVLKMLTHRVFPSENQLVQLYLMRGEHVQPTYTDKELAEGFEVMWTKNLNTAIFLLQQDKPTDYTGQFSQQRDLAILEMAKSMT